MPLHLAIVISCSSAASLSFLHDLHGIGHTYLAAKLTALFSGC
jgi:hypothetical protein